MPFILEVAPALNEADVYTEPHPERIFGIIPPEREGDFRQNGVNLDIIESLRPVLDGSVETIDGRNQVLVHHDENGNFVTSLESARRRKRLGQTKMRVLGHRALSLTLDSEGVIRGEGHDFTDLLIPGQRVRRKELLETVEPLTPEELDIFWQFSLKRNTALRQTA